MQGNQNVKFVDRFEKAIMQYAILEQARQQNGVTKDNLQQFFRTNIPQIKGNHLEECLNTLVQENHLRAEGNRYTVTDDGREDVQQVQPIANAVTTVVGTTGRTGTTTAATGGTTGRTGTTGTTGTR